MIRMGWVLGLLIMLFVGCSDDDSPVKSTNTNPEGRLYVLNQADGTFYVYDTRTLSRIDSVDSRVNRPHYIEFSPDRQNFYIVTLETTGRIAKFRTSDNAFLDSVTVPPAVQPSAIVITADGLFGYVCNFSLERGSVHKYNLATLQEVGSMQAGALTHDLKITSDGSVIVACNRDTDDLTLIYTDADTVAFVGADPDSSYALGRRKYGPFGVAIDHRDSLAFIACMDARQVRVLDIAAGEIVDSIDIPVDSGSIIWGPTLMAVAPDNDIVYVTTQGGNSVVAFRLSTKEILADIPLSVPHPFGITISDDGSRVYVACVNLPLEQGMVYVIDGATQTKIDSLQVGRESFGLIWMPPIP